MATATQTPKSPTEPTPLYALVGATELAVESVRHALAEASRRQAEVQAQLEQLQSELVKRRTDVRNLIHGRSWQAELEQVPELVRDRTLEAATKAEAQYEELAARGKTVVERLRGQKATQDLIDQGKVTLSRTKAAITTARHAAVDVAASARETLNVGRREANAVAEAAAASAEAAVTATKEAAEATAATARKQAARTRTATRGAATSVRKAAEAAIGAVESGAAQIID